jgi:SAM-dependent methyltransferase
VTLKQAVGRKILFWVRPPFDRRHDERGVCSVCGEATTFVRNSWILPPDMVRDLGQARLVEAFVRRESSWCGQCGSNLRVRRLADVLLEHYADAARSLAALVEEPGFGGLRVAEVNSIGAAHAVLDRHPRLRYSEYPGEDICALSYADGEFDLVLTSDTLEHVPDWRQALRETRRVLRDGGRHVFTIPLVPSRRQTAARDSLPPQYHGRGSGPLALLSRKRADFLAHTDFGMDVLDELRVCRFDPEVHFYDDRDPDADVAVVLCAMAV